MAVKPDVALVLDEVVLEGIAPEDPLVEEGLAQQLTPALEAHGIGSTAGSVTAAVSAALAREASP